MHSFCDRQHVSKTLEGKSIALVGSGPGVLENRRGFIDSHDVVVRVNNYKIFGEKTGIRTDVFYSFFGNSVKKKSDDLIRDGVKLCMCKCPNGTPVESEWHRLRGKTQGIDFSYIYEARKNWWFCPTYIPTVEEFIGFFKLMGNRVPTTGFYALLDILSYKPKSVYMTGFDFFESKIHNVTEPWRPRNPDDPIGHSPEAERVWLKKNINQIPVTMDKRLTKIIHS